MKKFKTNGRIFLSHDKTNPRPRQSYAIKYEKGYYPARRKMCNPPEFCLTARLTNGGRKIKGCTPQFHRRPSAREKAYLVLF